MLDLPRSLELLQRIPNKMPARKSISRKRGQMLTAHKYMSFFTPDVESKVTSDMPYWTAGSNKRINNKNFLSIFLRILFKIGKTKYKI